MFCLWPRIKETYFWMGWRDIPLPKKLKFQRSRIKTILIIFFDSQGVVHKEFVPEGKTVNVEFYKGAMDRLLKRIQRVRPTAFCSRDFFFCFKIMRPPTKLQVFDNFWPKKMLQPFITPLFSRFVSARLFSVPQVENEVKRTLLFGCYWDPRSRNWWIKYDPKRGIFGSFSEILRPRKSLYVRKWNLFWILKNVSSSCVFDF